MMLENCSQSLNSCIHDNPLLLIVGGVAVFVILIAIAIDQYFKMRYTIEQKQGIAKVVAKSTYQINENAVIPTATGITPILVPISSQKIAHEVLLNLVEFNVEASVDNYELYSTVKEGSEIKVKYSVVWDKWKKKHKDPHVISWIKNEDK